MHKKKKKDEEIHCIEFETELLLKCFDLIQKSKSTKIEKIPLSVLTLPHSGCRSRGHLPQPQPVVDNQFFSPEGQIIVYAISIEDQTLCETVSTTSKCRWSISGSKPTSQLSKADNPDNITVKENADQEP